jgi:hypothetical protein
MKSLLSLIISVLFLLVACKKNTVGGNAVVKGTVAHHSKSIANARVYVKYGTNDFPGADTTKYDYTFMVDNTGTFSQNFFKGNYYLYAIGFDYSIVPPFTVKGGIPVTLRTNEELDKTIAVTE